MPEASAEISLSLCRRPGNWRTTCEAGEIARHMAGSRPGSDQLAMKKKPQKHAFGTPPVTLKGFGPTQVWHPQPKGFVVMAAEAPPPPPPQVEDAARAAEEAAEAASLQRMAAEISLESHGYEPVRRLGGSATATVMVVNRLGEEQQFVVKAMALRGMDEQERRRALQEIKILKSLRHECIIEYVEFWWVGAGPQSSRVAFVMECGENGDLRVPVQAANQSGRYLEEVLVLSWLQQMLRGLEYVHQKEIIHRDLKAMNIFLKDTWRTCKLGDFGISTAVETGKSASGCVGTPAYMAPELLWNQRYASAVDLWAIGVVLYELMALRLPFVGSNVLSLVYQIAFNNYDDAPLQPGGYSPKLVDLVSRFMDKDPAMRPSAGHLLAESTLWEAYSWEAANLSATASFNDSMTRSKALEACEHLTPGIAEPTHFPQITGTGSSWGDVVPIVSLDSITGVPHEKSVVAETLGSMASRPVLRRFRVQFSLR